MLAILWGKSSSPHLQAAAEGLRACGYDTKFLRPQVPDVESCCEPCDLVVVAGTRLHSATVRDFYQRAGTPVLVLDVAPIRLPDHFAVTPWRVNQIPSVASSDRVHLLNSIPPVRKPGWKVLVCGQTAEDAAHLLTQAELGEWYLDTLSLLRDSWHEGVAWRPHPHNPEVIAPPEWVSVSEHDTIDEALDCGVAALVTFNSTCGLRALIRRVPTYCHPFSFYSEVAEVGLPTPFNLRIPSSDRLHAFLSRVMACQWSLDELTTDAPWRAALSRVGVTRYASASVAG